MNNEYLAWSVEARSGYDHGELLSIPGFLESDFYTGGRLFLTDPFRGCHEAPGGQASGGNVHPDPDLIPPGHGDPDHGGLLDAGLRLEHQQGLARLLVKMEVVGGARHCRGVGPGKHPDSVFVEARAQLGAVVVVVVTELKQAVAVPGPGPVKFVSPVVPAVAPLGHLISDVKAAVTSLCDEARDAESLDLLPLKVIELTVRGDLLLDRVVE